MELSRDSLIMSIMCQAQGMRYRHRLTLKGVVRVHVPREIEGLLSFGDRYLLKERYGIEVWNHD